MKMDTRRFEVRLANSDSDVRAAQNLRYRVFVEEMGADVSAQDHAAKIEQDRFDPYFDHLMLIDTTVAPGEHGDNVVGVYRLMRGEAARDGVGFYGAGEYDLSKLENTPRKTVELGRSCVAKAYRGGVGMHLLWDGLGDYVTSNNIEIMFGVASFHGADVAPLAEALSFLHHKHLAPEDLRVRALPEHYVSLNQMPMDAVDQKSALRTIPSLIKAYLRLGGMVGDGAFIDHDFNTVDVCLLMDTKRMVSKYREFYARKRG
ncbi:MAG: GNAT family N-acetyltransferase [Rhodobacteraceae bacterium]|nr:GNAT family N-acetyltransferase [Paracoccaceae bacterium]